MAERIVGRTAAANVVDPNTGEIVVRGTRRLTRRASRRSTRRAWSRCMCVPHSPVRPGKGFAACAMGAIWRAATWWNPVRQWASSPLSPLASPERSSPCAPSTLAVWPNEDITQGLPRVEELFEARNPKGQALVADIDGLVEISRRMSSARSRSYLPRCIVTSTLFPRLLGPGARRAEGGRGGLPAVKDSEAATQLGLPIADARTEA